MLLLVGPQDAHGKCAPEHEAVGLPRSYGGVRLSSENPGEE